MSACSAYAPETVQLVGYIRTAQRLGFSLAEIGENLPRSGVRRLPPRPSRRLLAGKVTAVDQKMEELTALKKALLDRVAQTCPLLAG